MLTHLQINDFTLVDRLELELSKGLTVLTGETGAGKSILLDALGLALGDRAEGDKVRAGCPRAEVSASFDLQALPEAQQWLRDQELDAEDCLIRRVVTKEGRSRAYVNGQPVTASQLKRLGESLIDIHSQHAHQSLLKTPTHRALVDAYGQLEKQSADVASAYQYWREQQDSYEQIKQDHDELNARFQLLSYQVEELSQLDVQADEVAELERKQKQLAQREQVLSLCQQVIDVCEEPDGGLEVQLSRVVKSMQALTNKSQGMTEATAMLESALVQIEEARREVDADRESLMDMEDDLQSVEDRLSAIYEVARKHRIQPDEVYDLYQQLSLELTNISSGDDLLAEVAERMAAARASYDKASKKLSGAREKISKTLSKKVNSQLAELAMSHASFHIALSPLDVPSRHGAESVEFLISTVPGQSPKPLAKVASGGELSRVSLAIQVVTAEASVTPNLVFDEVDVGIGGTTGDVVGKMLRDLGQSTQVLCVTHLAQVASKAHQHLKVEKLVSKKSATTQLRPLHGEQKVEEIARMMGGQHESE